MKRGSGILLHISSLPSDFGIGDLGPEAFHFADFLAETGQSYWQILPLNPTDPHAGSSPYRSSSAFAGNPLFISPEILCREGLIDEADLAAGSSLPRHRVDYPAVAVYKNDLFHKAFARFLEQGEAGEDYRQFRAENAFWLEDFILFAALRHYFQGNPWWQWPIPFRDRHPQELEKARRDLSESIAREGFLQYLFFRQWGQLRNYCRDRGIHIIGDMPIYVAQDSCDIWSNPELFKLDEKGHPLFVAGVPPDYFSATGQLWGDPVYDWRACRESGYQWWFARIEQNLKIVDTVRIDHFRGFAAYWEIPAGEKTAVNGRWVPGPGGDFFDNLRKRFRKLPLVAEDLGTITPDVHELMERFELPGMKVLLFAFDESLPRNPYIPHNHVKNCLVYTGTHDNNTVRGWFEEEVSAEDRDRLFDYLGRRVGAEEVSWEMLRLALMSVADVAILPVQDLLGLGAEGRMNRPSVPFGNWQWRLEKNRITAECISRLRHLTELFGRL
ncbi:MAG: 4-alpha-glucanotransferase [Desulfuromonadaceae bacterium]|nr:4-alpha-glucanotransferase [Desulfuromonadaceae bacterium]